MAFRPCVSVSCGFDDWFTCACAICMLCCAVAITSTHICAGNVSMRVFALFVGVIMFVSTHICVGNVSTYEEIFGEVEVSTHICAGNVLDIPTAIRDNLPLFQLIYARGMFQTLLTMMGEQEVSTHICAGNVFRVGLYTWGNAPVSTHICTGNVSACKIARSNLQAFRLIYTRGMFLVFRGRRHDVRQVSTHICAGNVSVAAGHTTLAMTLFQLIYAWGMFHGRAVDGAHHRRFNSYMCGECFGSLLCIHLLCGGFNSYMRGECFSIYAWFCHFRWCEPAGT